MPRSAKGCADGVATVIAPAARPLPHTQAHTSARYRFSRSRIQHTLQCLKLCPERPLLHPAGTTTFTALGQAAAAKFRAGANQQEVLRRVLESSEKVRYHSLI